MFSVCNVPAHTLTHWICAKFIQFNDEVWLVNEKKLNIDDIFCMLFYCRFLSFSFTRRLHVVFSNLRTHSLSMHCIYAENIYIYICEGYAMHKTRLFIKATAFNYALIVWACGCVCERVQRDNIEFNFENICAHRRSDCIRIVTLHICYYTYKIFAFSLSLRVCPRVIRTYFRLMCHWIWIWVEFCCHYCWSLFKARQLVQWRNI